MGPIGCPETSVSNYQSMLNNVSEDLRSHLRRGGSMKSPRYITYLQKSEIFVCLSLAALQSHFTISLLQQRLV